MEVNVRCGVDLEVWLDAQLQQMTDSAGDALASLVFGEKFPSTADTPYTGIGHNIVEHQGTGLTSPAPECDYMMGNPTGCDTPRLRTSHKRGVGIGSGSGWKERHTLYQPPNDDMKHASTKGYGHGGGCTSGHGGYTQMGESKYYGAPSDWCGRREVRGKRPSEYSER